MIHGKKSCPLGVSKKGERKSFVYLFLLASVCYVIKLISTVAFLFIHIGNMRVIVAVIML